MSLTTQYLQTGVHRHPPSLGLTMKITQQDIGRLIDIEHDMLCAAAANLNNHRPLKSPQGGHLSAPQRRSCANSLVRLLAEPSRYRCELRNVDTMPSRLAPRQLTCVADA